MKYVKDKPVRDLTAEQFLKLSLAEEEKLITISFNENIEGSTTNSYIDEVKQLYIRVSNSVFQEAGILLNNLCFRTSLAKRSRTGTLCAWNVWRGL